MRKRYAKIIRQGIIDVRNDWNGVAIWHSYFAVKLNTDREITLYFRAYNHELDNLEKRASTSKS